MQFYLWYGGRFWLFPKFLERNREGWRGAREGSECVREENQSGPGEGRCPERGVGEGLERATKVSDSAEEAPKRHREGVVKTLE